LFKRTRRPLPTAWPQLILLRPWGYGGQVSPSPRLRRRVRVDCYAPKELVPGSIPVPGVALGVPAERSVAAARCSDGVLTVEGQSEDGEAPSVADPNARKKCDLTQPGADTGPAASQRIASRTAEIKTAIRDPLTSFARDSQDARPNEGATSVHAGCQRIRRTLAKPSTASRTRVVAPLGLCLGLT
jgi:hypothetical protein